ncbi:MAG: GFA family protein [Pseudomonadota bacterium]
MSALSGSCLCGAVRYRVDGPLRDVIACHCQQCRKTSGHHVAATSALRTDITVEGQITWYRSSADAKRGFCGVCGSNLFWHHAESERLSIFAGTFDDDPGVRLAGHIFTADKGAYYQIADDLPSAPGADPALTTQR